MSPTLGDPAPTPEERIKLAYGSTGLKPPNIPPPLDLSSNYECMIHGDITRDKTFQVCVPGIDTGKSYCLLCCAEYLDKEIGILYAKPAKNVPSIAQEETKAGSPESDTPRPESAEQAPIAQ